MKNYGGELIRGFNVVFNLPAERNQKLKEVVELVDKDTETRQYLDCSNVTSIDRLGYNDHGYTHSKIVANIGLKIFRILAERLEPGVVKNYGLGREDAEVIVVLASVLHDVGMAVHREKHVEHGTAIGFHLLNRLIKHLYSEGERAIMVSETLHAMGSHEVGISPLTLEGGVVSIADALDMADGRARIPFSRGQVDIHSVSAMAIENVEIRKGEDGELLYIKIKMSNSAGIFQIDGLLKERIENSGLKDYIRVDAEITGKEKSIIKKIKL